MIFLSHNHKDKDVVEQFAIRLREVFGQDLNRPGYRGGSNL